MTDIKVYAKTIEKEAQEQIDNIMDSPAIEGSKVRIMPDVHAGAGCVIGFTMTIHDRVVPNLVGVDIGCGMLCIQLEETEFDPEKLDNIIRQYVPSGHDVHEKEDRTYTTAIDNLIAPVNTSLAYRSIGSLGGGELIATGAVKAVRS